MEQNAVRLTSSEPLPNRMLKIRKLFWLCLASTVFGLFIPFFMGVGILGFCIVYIIHNFTLTICRNQLRDMRFLSGDLSADELFVQPPVQSWQKTAGLCTPTGSDPSCL